MENYYHLLVETPCGNLSQIMQHINGAYTTFFNMRRQRSGHLFQGRYKAILVEADQYAKALSRYIHLNPVRAGILDKPEHYKWSNYRYYTVDSNSPQWLVRDFILSYFGQKASRAQRGYRDFVESLLAQQYKTPLRNVVNSTFLRSVDFLNEIKEKFLNNKKADRNLLLLRELAPRPAIDQIEKAVEWVVGGTEALSKQVTLFFCHRYGGRKLKEIGARFNIGESGVSQASRRVLMKMKTDNNLMKGIKLIEKELNLSKV